MPTVAAFRFAAVALACGVLAGVGVVAGAGADVATDSAGWAAAPLFPFDNLSFTDGPTATPRANTPMNAAVSADVLPTVMVHLPPLMKRFQILLGRVMQKDDLNQPDCDSVDNVASRLCSGGILQSL
jgi:hypothetical protein